MKSIASKWVPVILWMAGIFYFSHRPDPLSFLPDSGQELLVGRMAHFAEYAGLQLLLHRALAPERRRMADGGRQTRAAVSGRSPAVGIAITLAYALFDELHQELVPGRGFEWADIGVDLAGMMAASGLIWICDRLWQSAEDAR